MEKESLLELGSIAGATIAAGLAVQAGKAMFEGTRKAWRRIAIGTGVIVAVAAEVLAGSPVDQIGAGVFTGIVAGLAAIATFDLAQEHKGDHEA